ncbi:MAG: ABC-2 family transporter protein, partial [Oligoflexia bacterium]|nr:ABC-2 family transporter protein [Oligoflexia bacterium]
SILPLDLFPKTFVDILLWTPFPYLIYFPVKILMGDPVSSSFCFSVLFVWIVILFFVTKWIWKKGLSLYTGAGI